ncbi:MAG: hypothetical protein QM831_21660 [Kofleriaceae bacterium]
MLLAACAGPVDTSVARQADTKTVKYSEHVKCTRDLCVLLYGSDLDGDGIPDVDEKFLGSDPSDPKSRPTMAQIIFELENRELPTFEAGNGLVVTLPTRDAFGSKIFGGDPTSRADALAKLGIKVPDGFDVASGFTTSLTTSGDISYNTLPFVVPGSGWTDPPIVIRGMRDLEVEWETAEVQTEQSDDGWSESQWEADKELERDVGTEIVDETIAEIAAGRREVELDTEGGGTSKGSEDGTDQDTHSDPPPSEPGDYEEPSHDEHCDEDECQQASAGAYIDPDYMGTTEISPQTLHAILAARGNDTDVIQGGAPVGDFTWSPKSVGNKWGPIALYTPDNGGIAIDPMLVHIPALGPDYDPRLEEGMPPKDAPPSNTCLYCFQR